MKKVFAILVFAIFCASYSAGAQDNQLTPKETKQGWELLFNGKDLSGWKTLSKNTIEEGGWSVTSDGEIKHSAPSKWVDIITEEVFGDFELVLDFKTKSGSNSGIKYLYTRYSRSWLGLEFQILDFQLNKDGSINPNGKQLTGALYDIFTVQKPAQINKDGWNTARIVRKGSKISHYLNGKKVLSFDVSSEEYLEALKQSKFKNVQPTFGQVDEGHILLQDHGHDIYFKNIKIRKF